MVTAQTAGREPTEERSAALFQDSLRALHRRTDRTFAGLMVFQWLGGLAAACWISPRTWAGASSALHPHVWAALFLGGAFALLPIVLALARPGAMITRMGIAVCQMLMSALLIHLSGGRIETHFHVFGSLAFLAFYRDWRVLAVASVVVSADHFLRGIYFPRSIFGILAASPWRWVEHAGWVLFEDTFLVVAMGQGLREMRNSAAQQARLEQQNAALERQQAVLAENAACLRDANSRLEVLATLDGLTKLKNHRAFQERLEEEFQRARRYNQPLSLVLLDVDHFKGYNDAFGHPAGDEVLKTVAGVLDKNARDSDLAARYGGEEFAVLLPETGRAAATAVGERFRAAIAGAGWEKRPVTASIGVATLLPAMDSRTALVAAADQALYVAKQGGRNRVLHSLELPAQPLRLASR